MLGKILKCCSAGLAATIDQPLGLYAIRRAELGDRDGVLRMLDGVVPFERAAILAACCDLCGTRCGSGEVIHAWVATRGLDVVGVLAATDAGQQINLVDLVVDVPWRRLGIGLALLGELLDFADARRVPIVASVRGDDVYGLSWLCDRGFAPVRYLDGRVAIVPDAFAGEDCPEGIGLARPAPSGNEVRIAR